MDYVLLKVIATVVLDLYTLHFDITLLGERGDMISAMSMSLFEQQRWFNPNVEVPLKTFLWLQAWSFLLEASKETQEAFYLLDEDLHFEEEEQEDFESLDMDLLDRGESFSDEDLVYTKGLCSLPKPDSIDNREPLEYIGLHSLPLKKAQ